MHTYANINEAARQRQTIQLHPEQVLLIKELPWVGFEPMTLCSLGERCYPLRTAQHAGAQIYNTIQGKGNVHTYVRIWLVYVSVPWRLVW